MPRLESIFHFPAIACWAHFGIALGNFGAALGHSEVSMEKLWGRFGVALWLFLCHFADFGVLCRIAFYGKVVILKTFS